MNACRINIYKAVASMVGATCLVLFVCVAGFSQAAAGTAVKFDEFGDIMASDLIARLDYLAVQLQNAPNTKAFIVVYRTGRDLPGLSNRYAHRMEGYLVNSREIDPARIVTVDGGEASCLTQEIWIVPPGATPKPRDDAYQRSYHPAVYKFDEHYLGDKGELYYWRDSGNDLYEGFGLELQKNPKSIGYLITYSPRGRKTRPSAAKEFLTRHFGIKPGRINSIVGGYRERPVVELWIAEGKGAVPIISSYRYLPRRH